MNELINTSIHLFIYPSIENLLSTFVMKDKKMNRTWTQLSGSLEFNEEDQTHTGSTLVFQGYCNKVAETNLFSHVLEAGHPKLRCEQVHSPLEASRGRSSLASFSFL